MKAGIRRAFEQSKDSRTQRAFATQSCPFKGGKSFSNARAVEEGFDKCHEGHGIPGLQCAQRNPANPRVGGAGQALKQGTVDDVAAKFDGFGSTHGGCRLEGRLLNGGGGIRKATENCSSRFT